jgi:hypothetical protein
MNVVEVTTGGETPNPDPTPDPEVTTSTVAAVIAGADGEYQVEGTVVAVNAKGLLVKDSTGIIFVFVGSKPTVAVGDVVTVKGTTSVYGAAKQFGSSATVTKTGTAAVDHGTVKELTVTEIDAYKTATAVTPIYVKVKATLSKSGSYYNLTFAGAAITGSIPYPANAAELDALAGKEIEITGYAIYVSGGSTKYLNILAMNVVEVTTGGETPDPDPDHVVSGQTYTASKTISELIDANPDWTVGTNNATKLPSIQLDDNVTVTFDGGNNTGKVYSDGIRIYATDTPAGTITITVPNGYQLVSVKFTTSTGNYAFLCLDGTNTDISNTLVTVSGTQVKFNSVKNGSDGKQVRIATFEVVYQAVN